MASTDSVAPPRAATGIVLMVVAMLMIPIVDGQAKYLSTDYSPLFISWARYVVACLIVLPFAAARYGARRMFPAEQLAAHTLRTFFLVVSMTLYFVAVAQIPLATATSAYFVGPIIAVVLAVAVLKETLTGQKTAQPCARVCRRARHPEAWRSVRAEPSSGFRVGAVLRAIHDRHPPGVEGQRSGEDARVSVRGRSPAADAAGDRHLGGACARRPDLLYRHGRVFRRCPRPLDRSVPAYGRFDSGAVGATSN